jgi:hypothetical protein
VLKRVYILCQPTTGSWELEPDDPIVSCLECYKKENSMPSAEADEHSNFGLL